MGPTRESLAVLGRVRPAAGSPGASRKEGLRFLRAQLVQLVARGGLQLLQPVTVLGLQRAFVEFLVSPLQQFRLVGIEFQFAGLRDARSSMTRRTN